MKLKLLVFVCSVHEFFAMFAFHRAMAYVTDSPVRGSNKPLDDEGKEDDEDEEDDKLGESGPWNSKGAKADGHHLRESLTSKEPPYEVTS